jgi:hypothetical protein
VPPAHRLPGAVYSIDHAEAAGQSIWAVVEGPSGGYLESRRLGQDATNTDNTLVEIRPKHEVTGNAPDPAGLMAGDLVIDGVAIRAPRARDDLVSVHGEVVASAIALAAVIQEADTEVLARPRQTVLQGNAIGGGELPAPGALVVNGVGVPVRGAVELGDQAGRLEEAINAVSEMTGVMGSTVDVEIDGQRVGSLRLVALDGRNISVQVTPVASRVTGLVSGMTHGAVSLHHFAPFTIGGANPQAAGLSPGEVTADFSRWRITTRKIRCGDPEDL